MQNHRLLPPEIWLEIFDWAMYNPNFPIGESTPFQQISRGPRLPDPNLQVRATLSLVCRTWRVWAAQSLYRDILVGHDTNVLHKVLSAGEISGRRYREMVRIWPAAFGSFSAHAQLKSLIGSPRGSTLSQYCSGSSISSEIRRNITNVPILAYTSSTTRLVRR